jgi:WD40 repeat protein
VEKTVTRGHLSLVYTTAFTPDGLTLASGSYDGSTRLWTTTGTEPRERSLLRGDGLAIYTLSFSPDGRSLASGGAGTTFRLWDAVLGRELRRFQGHPSTITNLACTPDGKHILCTSGKELWLWDASNTTQVVRRLEGHELLINGSALSPDGKRALTCSGNYQYRNGQPVMKGGKYVYEDCTLRLWDLESGRQLHAVTHPTPFARTGYTPDGRGLSSTWDAANRIWDLAGPEPRDVAALQGRPGYAVRFVPSPDGTRLVTHWSNGQLVLWDLDTGKSLQVWTLPESIAGVAFASDGRHLAVALGTGVINVLRLAPPREP